MADSIDHEPWSWKPLLKRKHDTGNDKDVEDDEECQLSKYYRIDNVEMPENIIKCQIGPCQKVFSSLVEFEAHYNTRHKNVCSECKRYFLSEHVLNIHIEEWHDPFFAVKFENGVEKLFKCLDEPCEEVFNTLSERREHLIADHKFSASFKFSKNDYKKGKKENRRQIKNKIRPESALSIELESDGSVSPNTSPRCKSPTPSSSPSGSGRRVPNHLNFGHKLPMRAVSSLDHMKDLSAALDHHATENA